VTSLVIVGRSPSSESGGMGQVIDSFDTVIRLKRAETDPVNRGMKTDVIFSKTMAHRREGVGFWFHPNCIGLGVYEWNLLQPMMIQTKPSTGLCAILSALFILKPVEMALIGFDAMLHPDQQNDWSFGSHNMRNEHEMLKRLPCRFVDLYAQRMAA
jgi:hypothetical protein